LRAGHALILIGIFTRRRSTGGGKWGRSRVKNRDPLG
jgi:hypothetical protein